MQATSKDAFSQAASRCGSRPYSQISTTIQQIFVQYVHEEVISSEMKLGGDAIVEIDESHFGKKYKYHCGQVKSKIDVWVVGLVERGSSNKMIMYPVDKRDSATLLKIIKCHVYPGSIIYTDGWVGYNKLNEKGFQHFTVIHKDAYTKKYRNEETGEERSVDTNMIEGSWQMPKKYFKARHGSGVDNVRVTSCGSHLESHNVSKHLNIVVYNVHLHDSCIEYCFSKISEFQRSATCSNKTGRGTHNFLFYMTCLLVKKFISIDQFISIT